MFVCLKQLERLQVPARERVMNYLSSRVMDLDPPEPPKPDPRQGDLFGAPAPAPEAS